MYMWGPITSNNIGMDICEKFCGIAITFIFNISTQCSCDYLIKHNAMNVYWGVDT
jgi:hypothetical protein